MMYKNSLLLENNEVKAFYDLVIENNGLITKAQVLSFLGKSATEYDNYLMKNHIYLPVIMDNGVEKYDGDTILKVIMPLLGINQKTRLETITSLVETENFELESLKDVQQSKSITEQNCHNTYELYITKTNIMNKIYSIRNIPYVIQEPTPIPIYKTRELLGNITKPTLETILKWGLLTTIYYGKTDKHKTTKYACMKFELAEINAKASYIVELLQLLKEQSINKNVFSPLELRTYLGVTEAEYKRLKRKGLLCPSDKHTFSLNDLMLISKDLDKLRNFDYNYLDLDEIAIIIGLSKVSIKTKILEGVIKISNKVTVNGKEILLFDRTYIEQIGYMGLGLPKEQCSDFIAFTGELVTNTLNMNYERVKRLIQADYFPAPIKTCFGIFCTKEYLEQLKHSPIFDENILSAVEVKELLGITQNDWVKCCGSSYLNIQPSFSITMKNNAIRYFFNKTDILTKKNDILSYLNLTPAQKRAMTPKKLTTQGADVSKEYIEKNRPSGMLTVSEVSKIWGLAPRTIQELCSKGRVDGAIKIINVWYIPANSEKPTKSQNIIKSSEKHQQTCLETPKNMLNIQETAEKWGVSSTDTVVTLCETGCVSGAVKKNNNWYIPFDSNSPLQQLVGKNIELIASGKTNIEQSEPITTTVENIQIEQSNFIETNTKGSNKSVKTVSKPQETINKIENKQKDRAKNSFTIKNLVRSFKTKLYKLK